MFSLRWQINDGAFVNQGKIWLRDGMRELAVCNLDDIQLRGWHNVLNVLAAVTLADSVGVPVEAMQRAIQTFRGVEHRLELVRAIDGVQYINDSIATAPERVIAALDAIQEPIILLAGGRDKQMVWQPWVEKVRERVKAVVLFGALAELLEEHLKKTAAANKSDNPLVIRKDTLEAAVGAAAGLAEAGDVVLLSPGGTSYDAFNDFEERGQAFRELVDELVD
jgi:UDP-N-acetylmuramoylalanine--D-glutamate ligase